MNRLERFWNSLFPLFILLTALIFIIITTVNRNTELERQLYESRQELSESRHQINMLQVQLEYMRLEK